MDPTSMSPADGAQGCAGDGRGSPGRRYNATRPILKGMAAMVALVSALIMGPAVVGCASGDDLGSGGPTTSTLAPSTTTVPDETTSTSSPGVETTSLRVYFALGDKIQPVNRQVPRTAAVAASAVEELLKGPLESEIGVGLTTSVPKDTLLLGVTIADKAATVDLSRGFESGGGTLSIAMRLAQVVYTLTQFPTVETVEFKLDGEPVELFSSEGLILDHPVGRDAYEELTPAILVESPCIGDTVASPMRVWGTANTFEASFVINIVDWDGRIVKEQNVMATSGTGTRGTFDVSVPFEWDLYPRGALIAFESSAKDGSPLHVVEIPLSFE